MSTDAMIAFIPIDGSWCKQDFPHMTLAWGGPIDNMNEGDFNEMTKDAISASSLTGTFSLSVTGVETLGEGIDQVDALMLYPTPQLLLARKIVEKWDNTEFPEFVPHATIGPVGSALSTNDGSGFTRFSSDFVRSTLPTTLYFNRIASCWGDKRLIFDINNVF